MISILMIVLCFGCKSKKSIQGSKYESYDVKNDSIYNIIDKLCGDWDFCGKEKKELNESGIMFTSMFIDCYNFIQYDDDFQILSTEISVYSKDIKTTELFNQISIRKGIFLVDLDADFPNSANNIFLKESDSVVISKVDGYYGFQYFNNNQKFVPIKILNDSTLILVDGRQYERNE